MTQTSRTSSLSSALANQFKVKDEKLVEAIVALGEGQWKLLVKDYVSSLIIFSNST
jgi:hypothetical protein